MPPIKSSSPFPFTLSSPRTTGDASTATLKLHDVLPLKDKRLVMIDLAALQLRAISVSSGCNGGTGTLTVSTSGAGTRRATLVPSSRGNAAVAVYVNTDALSAQFYVSSLGTPQQQIEKPPSDETAYGEIVKALLQTFNLPMSTNRHVPAIGSVVAKWSDAPSGCSLQSAVLAASFSFSDAVTRTTGGFDTDPNRLAIADFVSVCSDDAAVLTISDINDNVMASSSGELASAARAPSSITVAHIDVRTQLIKLHARSRTYCGADFSHWRSPVAQGGNVLGNSTTITIQIAPYSDFIAFAVYVPSRTGLPLAPGCCVGEHSAVVVGPSRLRAVAAPAITRDSPTSAPPTTVKRQACAPGPGDSDDGWYAKASCRKSVGSINSA